MAKPLGDILPKQLRTSAGKADARNKLIIAVRAAARRKGMDDDDRRALQMEVVGKASMKDMTPSEIGRVLDRLNQDRPAPAGRGALLGKVKALWWTCYWLGAIEHANDQALETFVQRQTGLSSIRFLDHRQSPAVIEALKSMATRAGVKWPTDAEVQEDNHYHGVDRAHCERRAVLTALWDKLVDAKAVFGISPWDYLIPALGLSANSHAWSPREQDDAIRLLGKRLRRVLQKRGDE